VVDAWMGNSSRVRRRHYLKVTDADFERAASYPVQNPVPSAAVTGHQEPSALHGARKKTLDVRKDAQNQYPRQGSNKPRNGRRNGQPPIFPAQIPAQSSSTACRSFSASLPA